MKYVLIVLIAWIVLLVFALAFFKWLNGRDLERGRARWRSKGKGNGGL